MQYNPYAAPAAPVGPAAPGPMMGQPQPWDVSDVIKSGWEIYKTHWAPMTLGIFVGALIGAVPGQVAPGLTAAGVLEEGSSLYWAVNGPMVILGQVVAQFFAAGMTRAALRASRENTVTIGDFFSAGGRFVSFLLMSLLRTLAVAFGFLLLIVPGVILSLGFFNAGFYVVDQGLGPIEALKRSWESTDGQKGQLFVFSLAELGITILGILACCFGLFVAAPVCLLARALIYMRMSGSGPAAPAYTPQGPVVGVPGGGYGGPPGYGPPPGGGYGGGPPGY
ncbi:MAG: hypothetical protein KIT84_29575 [Labilithrix sp.]|nr:hypothetical protein [Labilithrix sp.]MCW5815213.1 hypothetical protein [Labilithrix sp.]